MVFVKSPLHSGSVWVNTRTLAGVKHWIGESKGVDEDCFLFYTNGRKVDHLDTQFEHNATVEAVLTLPGGKGGFGSMLRMIGAQIEKTTNKEACRDLSGRRLRDINEEARLRNYVNKKAEREQIETEKKAAKIEKLRKFVTEGESKHEFHDPKYDAAREAATERVHDAVEQAFADAKPSSSGGAKRKLEEQTKPSTSGGTKPKGLWVGVDLTESDLEDSSDEDEPTPPKKSKAVAAAVC